MTIDKSLCLMSVYMWIKTMPCVMIMGVCIKNEYVLKRRWKKFIFVAVHELDEVQLIQFIKRENTGGIIENSNRIIIFRVGDVSYRFILEFDNWVYKFFHCVSP